MATSTFTLPVPWRGENERGLSGVVEVTSSDLENEDVVEPRVGDLIAVSSKKIQKLYAGSDFQPVVKSLMFHGVKVSSNALVKYLVPELVCSSPRFVATTQLWTQGVMTVFVRTLRGSHIGICCSSTDPVAVIKTKIEAKEGIPFESQWLTFAGKQLQDHLPLSVYNIGNATTLQLSLRLLGGEIPPQTFADVSNGSIFTATEFSPRAPAWRRCSRGLNIEGRCMNRACGAFGQMIIDPKGFEWFNVVRDGNVKCPLCRGNVKPVTCGLYNCSWRYEGVKRSDDTSMGCPWRDARGYVYHWFDADETHGSVSWSSLVLVAKPRTEPVIANFALTESVQVNKDDLCSVCYSPFGSQYQTTTTTTHCGHTFHRVCSQKWAQYCRSHNTQPSCAICRRST